MACTGPAAPLDQKVKALGRERLGPLRIPCERLQCCHEPAVRLRIPDHLGLSLAKKFAGPQKIVTTSVVKGGRDKDGNLHPRSARRTPGWFQEIMRQKETPFARGGPEVVPGVVVREGRAGPGAVKAPRPHLAAGRPEDGHHPSFLRASRMTTSRHQPMPVDERREGLSEGPPPAIPRTRRQGAGGRAGRKPGQPPIEKWDVSDRYSPPLEDRAGPGSEAYPAFNPQTGNRWLPSGLSPWVRSWPAPAPDRPARSPSIRPRGSAGRPCGRARRLSLRRPPPPPLA